MNMYGTSIATSAAVLAAAAMMLGLAAPQAVAQQGGDAQSCLDELRAFNQRADRDGYWVAAWGPVRGYAARPGAGGTAPAQETTPPAATTGQAADGAGADTRAYAPWIGERWGLMSAGYQIRTLHAAANVLARRGDSDGCKHVVAEMRDAYDAHVAELKQAGVKPNEVMSWRQQQILQAKPVTQLDGGLVSADAITGAEVRNAKDVDLGTVDDVILDPGTGEIRYVIISEGGFAGIGNEFVPVPWNAMKATPGMNLLVLDATEQAIEQAPNVDPDGFADPDKSAAQRQEVDEYWKQHKQG